MIKTFDTIKEAKKRFKELQHDISESCGERLLNIFQPSVCVFRLGYTDTRIDAYIDRIDIVDGKESDLHIDKPVYAIHFRLKGDKDGTF